MPSACEIRLPALILPKFIKSACGATLCGAYCAWCIHNFLSARSGIAIPCTSRSFYNHDVPSACEIRLPALILPKFIKSACGATLCGAYCAWCIHNFLSARSGIAIPCTSRSFYNHDVPSACEIRLPALILPKFIKSACGATLCGAYCAWCIHNFLSARSGIAIPCTSRSFYNHDVPSACEIRLPALILPKFIKSACGATLCGAYCAWCIHNFLSARSGIAIPCTSRSFYNHDVPSACEIRLPALILPKFIKSACGATLCGAYCAWCIHNFLSARSGIAIPCTSGSFYNHDVPSACEIVCQSVLLFLVGAEQQHGAATNSSPANLGVAINCSPYMHWRSAAALKSRS